MTQPIKGKPVVYQVFTRLFGNRNATNKPWGTIADNGIGKFSDFDDIALKAIENYGVSHLWYTGVPHHAIISEYAGIKNDHPEVVKGRAGSPYAVKDYYNVNPDLALEPDNRMQEFEALIKRTHKHHMKVILDIVPNHVARCYQSANAPEGVRDFGADDNTSEAYSRDNNFYYLPGESFQTPDYPEGFEPLGGEFDVTTNGHFTETPAKWTGDGARHAKPHWDDWFETVKINYGIRPDGSKDFPELPDGFEHQDYAAHAEFWKNQSVPSSWIKFRDIALFWLDKGIDGFRYDMAEMVPVEFWSFLNSTIKMHNPEAELIAEVYQTQLYRDYIFKGKMDYLYDKVDVYDTLKDIVQGNAGTHRIDEDQQKLWDIDSHLLRFLENHDEQRIASPEFAGSAKKGWPAMVVTTLLGQGPTLLYFGQAQGEKASQDLGFGRASRTTIFDYAGVPAHQAWMNNGRFDGGRLNQSQRELDTAYQRLLSYSADETSLQGDFIGLHDVNSQHQNGYDGRCYSFIRRTDQEWVLVFVNFDQYPRQCTLHIPEQVCSQLSGASAGVTLIEKINEDWLQRVMSNSDAGGLEIMIDCEGYSAQVFKLSSVV